MNKYEWIINDKIIFVNFILYAYTKFHIYIYAIWRRFCYLKNHEKPHFCNQTPYVISTPDFMISGKP